MGADVKLIIGPSNENIRLSNNNVISVETALQMHEACLSEFKNSDLFIASAAVADFRPENPQNQKIKKEAGQDSTTIKMVKNPDILESAGRLKKPHQILVGFALETENQIENAKQKILNKNLDLIILNSPNKAGEGFGHNTNRITLIDKSNKITNFELMHKRQMAIEIAKYIAYSF
jgi:phosphopantothenoylcysteine decarboxylase / phosphopantothenate---cysteine ligase